MLGNQCNMNCRYCMQHSLVKNPLPLQKASKRFYDFLRKAHEKNNKLQVCFFGGEPLVYYNNIKEVVEKLPGINYGLITNGRALTDEMVDFFNANKMNVTISWDGTHVMETRRYDVFSSPVLKHRILRIENLGLSGVCSAYCYPLDILSSFAKIDAVYAPLHKRHIGTNIDTIFDTGMSDKSLVNVDYNRVKREMEYLYDVYDKDKEAPFVYKNFIRNQLWRSGEYKGYCYCGNGYTTINIDLDGNLYECHNVSEPIGRVDGSIREYFHEVLKRDTTQERVSTLCQGCIALPICKGGCKLMKNLDDYCKLKRAFYGTIIERCIEREEHAE